MILTARPPERQQKLKKLQDIEIPPKLSLFGKAQREVKACPGGNTQIRNWILKPSI
jgi:hypothetical protein